MSGPGATPTDPAKQRVPRPVILVGWVSFFADVSSEMAYPLLPLFLVGTLGAPATALGVVEGAAVGAVALLAVFSGKRSDRSGRRLPWVRLGYGLPVLGKSLVAAATAWPAVLAGRLIDRVGKGLRSGPRDALIADSVPREMLGRAFGLHRAMDTAGALTGVVLSAGLLWALGRWHAGSAEKDGDGHLRIALAVSAVLALVSLGVTFLLKEPARASGPPKPESKPLAGAGGLPAPYWRTIAVLTVFAAANSSDAFLLLRAGQVGLSAWEVVAAYALFNLTYTVVSYPAGVLADRIGRWRVIGIGWAVYILVYSGFAMLDHARWGAAWMVWPLMATYGVYMGLTDGVGKALVAQVAPAERRGTAMGVFVMTTGLASVGGSVAAGAVWDLKSPAAAMWLGAGLAAAALALIPLAARRSRR
jgi:MFS family permease